MDVGTSEDGAFWLAFLRSLSARGLSGVELVISDAHRGLRDAIATVFAGASWQRCRTHFMTNLLTRVPRSAQPWVATMVRTIYQQPSPQEVHSQLERVVDQLSERFPQASSMLAEAGADVLAFTGFPGAHWKQVWSNNPQERLNKEIRRRTDVVGIFPNRPAVRRLIGAVLAEQHDEWAVGRRYLTPGVTTKQEALQEVSHNQPRPDTINRGLSSTIRMTHSYTTSGDSGDLTDAYRAGCSRRHSPAGDAVCCALCLCLRAHSTTRSYACGWFPCTVCAPDAAQRSSLPPILHWALYDLDDRGRVRLLLPYCKPPECTWCGVRSLPPMSLPAPSSYVPPVRCLVPEVLPALAELVSEVSAPLSAAKWCDDRRNNT